MAKKTTYEELEQMTMELKNEAAKRKQTEDRLKHLNLVLHAIRKINQLIVTEKDRDRLIQSVCNTLIETLGYFNVWIALFDESNQVAKTVESGLGKDFKLMAEKLARGELTLCAQKAIKQSGVVVTHDPLSVCGDCPLAHLYEGRTGYTIKLEHNGNIYGMLSASIPKEFAGDGEEQRLFKEVAEDIAFGLNSIKQEEKQKQTEQALKESEELYRTLVEGTTDAILMLDTERNIVSCNQAFVDLFGYNKNEIKGKSIRLIHKTDESFNAFGETIYPAIERSGSHRIEWESVTKGGATLPVETVTSAIKSSDGLLTGYVAIIRDMTGQKKLRDQLQQSQKMEAIGTLAGGVAHDFNNLLTIIMGSAELALIKASKDTDIYDTLKEIRNTGNKAASLTRQLLAFSRKQLIQPVALNLSEILTNLEKMLRRLIGEDIDLKTVYGPDLYKIEADPGQIEQVVMNLSVNARDAMPKGGSLTIETANIDLNADYFKDHGVEDKPGPYVMLAITDTGKGMDKETQSRIFEPFFTTKGIGRGTGLGLSTVYGIVKQNNGHIWVYSEPERGTTFKIYFPRSQKDKKTIKKDKSPESSLKGTETILIVEDDETLCTMTEMMLKGYGYNILTALSGREALEKISTHKGPVDLLLTDVVMPAMDGKKLTGIIQQKHPKIRTIYMSGYTDNVIAHYGILEEGLNFIQKPFSRKDLARKVREALD